MFISVCGIKHTHIYILDTPTSNLTLLVEVSPALLGNPSGF